MKYNLIILFIIVLIGFTSLIKSSTRELEANIFISEERIKILTNKKELILLENNFLSSPNRLFDLKKKLFNEDLISLNIKNFIILEKYEK
tara:strand:- start:6911 stop:7180 length:270 start_codon:yes stop_codon:yes gene_type:complete